MNTNTNHSELSPEYYLRALIKQACKVTC